MSTDNVTQYDPKSDAATKAAFELHPEDRAKIIEEMHHYDNSRAASIGALNIVQRRHGWVPDEAMPLIADLINISVADLEGVATFYNMIFRQPVGRNVIKVCDSIACHLTDYQSLVAYITDKFGISFGETTGDGRYTLLPVCCLGACDRAPVIMINDDTHFNVGVNDLDQILEQYA